MVSRPVVSGPLAGLLLGDPLTGMYVGALLELVTLHQLPVGASRGWDTGPASVAAVTATVALAAGSVGLLIGVGFGVLVGWLGSWSVHVMRQLTGHFAAFENREPVTAVGLTSRHTLAIFVDFVRGAFLTLLSVLIAMPVIAGMGEAPAAAAAVATGVLLVGASVALGVVVRVMVKGRSVIAGFTVGLIVSSLLSLWIL